MKSTILFTILILNAFTLFAKSDSLIIGKEYKLLTINGWETIGILLAQDSVSILLRTEYKVLTISRSQIEEIVLSSNDFKSLRDKKQYELYTVYLYDKSILRNCELRKFTNDTLLIKYNLNKVKLPISNIKKIVFKNEAHPVRGVLVGSLIAGTIGAIISSSTIDYGFSFYTGLLFGGLTGWGIAALVGADDEYDFTEMKNDEKIKEIKFILEDQ